MKIVSLENLPADHRLRNTAFGDLDVTIICRHTRSKRSPKTWKIKGDSFNRLSDTWKANFDFQAEIPCTPCNSP